MGGSEGGLEFFDARSPDCSPEQFLECGLAADGADSLSHGFGHMVEPGVEDVENCLAGVLDEAFLAAFLTAFEDAFLEAFLDTFLETFLETFFKGEFFEEGDVGHGCVGKALLELFSELELKVVGQGYQPVDQVMQ